MVPTSERQIHDPSAIDGILRGLTNRPNVQSTLILSRKDGSIIRATGFKDARDSSTLGRQSYAIPQTPEKSYPEQDKGYTGLESAIPSGQSITMTQAERLANCIHVFVTASADLAGSMLGSDSMVELYHGQTTDTATPTQGEKREGSSVGHLADQDVQLLRMRTKKQEIIIFPDPSYLCCVIQDIGKAAT